MFSLSGNSDDGLECAIFAALRFRYLNIKNSYAAFGVGTLALLLYLLIWQHAQDPAGGQDSWNHLLYARWSTTHPELMLDQWGKPLFTIPAIPFSYMGIGGLYLFNILCTLLAGYFVYQTARRLGMRLPWMAAVFFFFQPVVFGNVISGLTEPINALALSIVCWLFAGQRNKSAVILSSFLPFFRTEGFVLLAAVAVYVVARNKWRLLPLLLTGSVFFSIIGVLVSGELSWLVTQNPYFRFESVGTFDPGHGDFLHYVRNQRHITGLVVTGLVAMALLWLAAHVVYLLKRKTPEEKSKFSFWLLAPLFLSFFLAHSYIWWKGSMGSHGLIRVFYVVAPVAALLALYAFDRLLSFDIRFVNKPIPIVLMAACITLAYAGNGFPVPWSSATTISGFPGAPGLKKAEGFIKNQGLWHHPIVHQLPFLNAQWGLDPWAKPEKARTWYLWSLDKRVGKDWLPDSCVVIWDGFHAVRDAPMPLDSMRAQKQYKEMAFFPGVDSIYDVRVFLKVAK